jgi:hypothetical protein
LKSQDSDAYQPVPEPIIHKIQTVIKHKIYETEAFLIAKEIVAK